MGKAVTAHCSMKNKYHVPNSDVSGLGVYGSEFRPFLFLLLTTFNDGPLMYKETRMNPSPKSETETL